MEGEDIAIFTSIIISYIVNFFSLIASIIVFFMFNGSSKDKKKIHIRFAMKSLCISEIFFSFFYSINLTLRTIRVFYKSINIKKYLLVYR
jgi:hypothetical protein